MIDANVRATLAADWTAFAETLAPDVVAYPPNAEPLSGREAFVEFVKTFPRITGLVEVAEIVGRADFAVATGKYHLTLQMPTARLHRMTAHLSKCISASRTVAGPAHI